MAEVEILILPKKFDYSYHRKLEEQSIQLLEKPTCKEIILDFSKVEYLDSAAIGMIILLQKKSVLKNKVIKIKGAHGATADILDMAHLKKIFEFI